MKGMKDYIFKLGFVFKEIFKAEAGIFFFNWFDGYNWN